MLIYTGNAEGESLEHVKRLGMGIMLASTTSNHRPSVKYKGIPCALDNGAFQCYRRGFPFMQDVFLQAISDAYSSNLSLDFIVCPDMVAGGLESLRFSLEWANGRLRTCRRLALAVQDGMRPCDIERHLGLFSTVFVGGTPAWKWATVQGWVSLAHSKDKRLHVGQVGTLKRLDFCRDCGVDSVDSTNFVRNRAWSTVERHLGNGSMNLWEESK